MLLSPNLAEIIQDKAKTILKDEVMVADVEGHILVGENIRERFSADAARAGQTGLPTSVPHDAKTLTWCPFHFNNTVLGEFGLLRETNRPSPEVINLIQGLTEVLVHQYMIERLYSRAALQAEFLSELMINPAVDPESVHRQADILQINLRLPRAVILVEAANFTESTMAEYQELSEEEAMAKITEHTQSLSTELTQALDETDQNLLLYTGHNRFLILKALAGDNLNTVNTARFLRDRATRIHQFFKTTLNLPITLGAGQYYPDLGGLRKSYQDATLALKVGTKVWGKDQIYHIQDVGMFVALSNIPLDRKAELAYQIMHPLLTDRELLKTVQTFLASGLNLTEAARKLHVHRNTLIYRLEKTKRLIRLDPRHFEDALQIKLGLMFSQPAS